MRKLLIILSLLAMCFIHGLAKDYYTRRRLIMRRLTIYACALICLYSCHSQDGNKQINKKEDSNIVEINLFPTSCADDVRYSIDVRNDSLFVINYQPSNGNEPRTSCIKLSYYEMERIDSLITLINSPIRNTDEVEDAWGIKMIINGITIYEETDFSIRKETNVMLELINYLISLSPEKIELYGFS